jgi:L-ribulose-5-phosphate 3-epimerase UlaE
MKKLPEGHLDRYDWSKATRGRLAKRIASEGTNLRALDDDVARAFPDSASVNAALRAALAVGDALALLSGRRRARRVA